MWVVECRWTELTSFRRRVHCPLPSQQRSSILSAAKFTGGYKQLTFRGPDRIKSEPNHWFARKAHPTITPPRRTHFLFCFSSNSLVSVTSSKGLLRVWGCPPYIMSLVEVQRYKLAWALGTKVAGHLHWLKPWLCVLVVLTDFSFALVQNLMVRLD